MMIKEETQPPQPWFSPHRWRVKISKIIRKSNRQLR